MSKKHLRITLPLLTLLFTVPATAGDASSERPLVIEQDHTFSRDQARERVQQLLDYWAQRFGVRRHWRGDVAYVQGHVMGVSIDARLVVGDHHVEARASDPGFLVRGAALDYVHRKLRKYLNPTYNE